MNTPRYNFPTATVSGGPTRVLIFNTEAVKLLRQGGAKKIAILIDPNTGVVSLKPIEIPNCVAVVTLHGQSDSCWQPRITFSSNYGDGLTRGICYRCQWDDVNEQLQVLPEALERKSPKRNRKITS